MNTTIFDTQGHTALMNAAILGDTALVVTLLTQGTDVHTRSHGEKDRQGTALMMAVWGGHFDIVQVLCEAGADVNVADDIGETPLIIALSQGHKNIVSYLISQGAEVNHADNTGRTALIWAGRDCGDVEVFELLLASGAKRGAKDSNGFSALDYAERIGRERVVALLRAENA
jgi:ankyrin repeat protein